MISFIRMLFAPSRTPEGYTCYESMLTCGCDNCIRIFSEDVK